MTQHSSAKVVPMTMISLGCAALLLAAAACGGEPVDETTDNTQAVSQAATTATGAAAELAAPLAPQVAQLEQLKAQVSESQARQYVEAGITGEGGVQNPTCVRFNWTGGLSGGATFTGCTLEGGQTLDGTVALAIKLRPQVSVTLTLTQLMVGGDTLSGAMVISGRKDAATITATLSFTSADGKTQVSLSNVTVTTTASTVTLSGSGTIKSDAIDTAFTASSLVWQRGDCLPSAGSLTYTQGGQTVTVTFLPVTPGTGQVQLQVGSLPAKQVALLPACPA